MSIAGENVRLLTNADAERFDQINYCSGAEPAFPIKRFAEGPNYSNSGEERRSFGIECREPQIVSGTADAECIALIEPRQFLRECMLQGFRARFGHSMLSFSTIEEFERYPFCVQPRLVLVSLAGIKDLDAEGRQAAVERLAALASQAPAVVLASSQDPQLMRGALSAGVRGFIPMSIGFDLAIEAVRFVLAGGKYVPVEYLMNSVETSAPAPLHPEHPAITAREMHVVRAIKQGKSNKIIAYELSMCESTVKVHVRHIMKKLGAKNRTAVAMYASHW